MTPARQFIPQLKIHRRTNTGPVPPISFAAITDNKPAKEVEPQAKRLNRDNVENREPFKKTPLVFS
jgi:hypothetical protein